MFVEIQERTAAAATRQTITAEQILRTLARRAQAMFLVSHYMGIHRDVEVLYPVLERVLEVSRQLGWKEFRVPCPAESSASRGWNTALGRMKRFTPRGTVNFRLLWAPGPQDTGEPPEPDAEQVGYHLSFVRQGFAARNARQADTALRALIGYVNTFGHQEAEVNVPAWSDFAVFLTERLAALGETFYFHFGPAEVVERKAKPLPAAVRASKQARSLRDRNAYLEKVARTRAYTSDHNRAAKCGFIHVARKCRQDV